MLTVKISNKLCLVILPIWKKNKGENGLGVGDGCLKVNDQHQHQPVLQEGLGQGRGSLNAKKDWGEKQWQEQERQRQEQK